jgi:hypothetical protein
MFGSLSGVLPAVTMDCTALLCRTSARISYNYCVYRYIPACFYGVVVYEE